MSVLKEEFKKIDEKGVFFNAHAFEIVLDRGQIAIMPAPKSGVVYTCQISNTDDIIPIHNDCSTQKVFFLPDICLIGRGKDPVEAQTIILTQLKQVFISLIDLLQKETKAELGDIFIWFFVKKDLRFEPTSTKIAEDQPPVEGMFGETIVSIAVHI